MRDIRPSSEGAPPPERSIRNIPVSVNHRKHPAPKEVTQQAPQTPVAAEEYDMPPPQTPRPKRPRRSMHGLSFWLIAVILICGGAGLLLSTVFAGASVTLHPKTVSASVSAALPAQLNASVGTLSYQTYTVTRAATTTVPATGTTNVSKQATGNITIYNNYSTASQRLIANTRFAAPDGKIYRVHNSVVVPGATKKADGTLTPGSVAADIFADSPGADYNRSGDTTYTIPGFQGDPRYSKFYAESKTPISGGFVGQQASVAAADLASAQATLQKGLDTDVRSAAGIAIPDGFIAIPSTLKVTYSDILQTPAGNANAYLTQSATAVGAMVRANDLATAIAKASVQGYAGEAIAFKDPSAITITATSSKQADTLSLLVSGTPILVWQFDPIAVKTALLGKNKKTFQDIVQSFAPAIDCTTTYPCDAKIRPFWTSSFPTDPEKISITTTSGE